MKIAAIPRSSNNGTPNSGTGVKPQHKSQKRPEPQIKRTDPSSSSNSSCCSACTESDSSSAVGGKSARHHVRPKKASKTHHRSKGTVTAKAPVPVPKAAPTAPSSSSDSDSYSSDAYSADPPSIPAKRPVLPKATIGTVSRLSNHQPTQQQQQQRAEMSKINKIIVEHQLGADGASSSDMELPALVNAAIQRVESCSDGEASKSEPNIQYTSSLLFDFMVKTQMLGSTASPLASTPSTTEAATAGQSALTLEPSVAIVPKRKRGRPKKQIVVPLTVQTSESPDSGIISTPHSPVPVMEPKKPSVGRGKYIRKPTEAVAAVATTTTSLPKLNISSLEKSMYATERVLYPPRRKQRVASTSAATAKSSKIDDLLDPVWRKIDINKKFRRPSVSGYKSDGGTVCSKVLAAQSNYVTDYRSISQRIPSGYKSDYSCKSKRSVSGYKSDCSLKAKSCGYRSDCSGKHRKKVRRKRRLKMINTKSPVNDLDILQLAGLSLGQSEESSRDSLQKSSDVAGRCNGSSSLMKKSTFRKKNSTAVAKPAASTTTTSKDILSNLCERVTKRLTGLDPQMKQNFTFNRSLSDLYKSKTTLPKSSALITCRRASAVSHCSSRSNGSRMHFRKRRRKRFKSHCRSEPEINVSKLNSQIDMLIDLFPELCRIHNDRLVAAAAAVAVGSSAAKVSSKRVQKKRKGSENHDLGASSSGQTTQSKRRYKKALQVQSPDDHKLPLKKRHYLLTPDGKHLTDDPANARQALVAENATIRTDDSSTATATPPPTRSAASAQKHNLKLAAKAVTPKKRHLLESPDSNHFLNLTIIDALPFDIDSRESLIVPLPESVQLKYQQQSKKNDISRKKNRLEVLVAQISPAQGSQTSETSSTTSTKHHRPSVIRGTIVEPPPGVFEPTIDLEMPGYRTPITNAVAPLTAIAKTELETSGQPSPSTSSSRCTPSVGTEQLVKDEPALRCAERVLEQLLSKTGGHLMLRKKRKKQNRTGFPTVRKKKKKQGEADNISETFEPLDLVQPPVPLIEKPIGVPAVVEPLTSGSDCDRVPQVGEPADKFLERNSRPRLSVVSLERLQGKVQSRNDTPAAGELNKRSRDHSKDGTVATVAQTASKKYKTDAPPSITVKENLKKTRTVRDISSDNEPLISFVTSKKRRHKLLEKSAENRARLSMADCSEPAERLKEFELIMVPATRETQKAKRGGKLTDQSQENHIQDQLTKPSRFPVVKLKILDESSYLPFTPRQTKKPPGRPLKRRPADYDSEVRVPVIAPSEQVPIVAKETASLANGHKKKCPTVKKSLVEPIVIPQNDIPVEQSQPNGIHPDVELDAADAHESLNMNYAEHDPLPVSEGPVTRDSSVDGGSDTPITKKFAKLRKKYLVAGLFSDHYKVLTKSVIEKTISRDENAGGLLPPPIYCENYFRRSQIDFELPYTIWLAHQNGKLTGRNLVPSWNYKKIRTNVYSDVRPPNFTTDQQPICHCKLDTECGDDCLNRLMYTECSPKTCPCADRCGNTKIQRHLTAPGVERFMTEKKGWGVKAKQPIKKGIYILEYVGEVVTEREFKDRMATRYTSDTHHYCLNLDGGLVIDGHRMGSDGRFVNHSCSPNCEMQKWSVNGLFRMALFAMRDIDPGEELTYDYNFSLFNPAEGQPCRCETPQCRGVIGGKSQRVKAIVETETGIQTAKNINNNNKGRTGRPKKNQANKNQSFMHSKDLKNLANYLQPTSKELCYIRNGNCFLMRNIRKVSLSYLSTRVRRETIIHIFYRDVNFYLTHHMFSILRFVEARNRLHHVLPTHQRQQF